MSADAAVVGFLGVQVVQLGVGAAPEAEVGRRPSFRPVRNPIRPRLPHGRDPEPEQLVQARAAGCDRGQGFYFAELLAREAVDAFLS